MSPRLDGLRAGLKYSAGAAAATVRLGWNPAVRIGRDRPAPNPHGLIFTDDLAAIADHGSPGAIWRPLSSQAWASPLAAAHRP